MRAFLRVLFAVSVITILAACGQSHTTLPAGQTFALAPDLSVRLVSYRPSLTELQLQITLLPTGHTPVESLVPSVVVIPSGGKETSSTLDFKAAGALITMVLADAQHVDTVTIRDARSGQSAEWAVVGAVTLLPCPGSSNCQVIGLPHAQSLPGRP
jgi:hypothetical protein